MKVNGPRRIAGNAAFFALFLSLPIAGILLQTSLDRFLELIGENPLVAAGVAVFFLFMVLFTEHGGGSAQG